MDEGSASQNCLTSSYGSRVFTLPARISAIRHHNKAVGLRLLFKASSQTCRTLAADLPQAPRRQMASPAVLHTWGLLLITHHPHFPHDRARVGGISLDGTRWIGGCRSN